MWRPAFFTAMIAPASVHQPPLNQLEIEEKGIRVLHRVLLASVVEVFINGKECVALRVYPGREDSLGVSLRAQGGNAELKSLDAWPMKSIYPSRGSTTDG